jgi:hypothetical protein
LIHILHSSPGNNTQKSREVPGNLTCLSQDPQTESYLIANCLGLFLIDQINQLGAELIDYWFRQYEPCLPEKVE